jgi:hypothetical protein
MAMNTYDSSQLQRGANMYGSAGTGGYSQPGGNPYAGGYGDINPEGAAADPFAYTEGSLLTPWQGRFSSSGYGGGYAAPEFTPFSYADFGYNAPSPGRFTESYADPAAFRFADFQGPSDFKAPTAEDMRADPGYQARMDAVKQQQVAGAAHGGVLRTGGFQKGLAQAVGNQASQEYGNVYGRQAQEHERRRREAESNYGINQGNTKQAFDTNIANKLQAYQTRQGTWRDNANVALQEGQLGFNIAQGAWDRNYAKARQGYDDAAAHAAQVAAASGANARAGYENDLADYNRARDEFWTNQDRQYAILDRERNVGMGAADKFAGYVSGGYQNMGNNAVARGDADAGRFMASGNAYGNYMGDVGNYAGAAAMYGSRPSTPTYIPRTPTGNLYGGNMPGSPMPMPTVPGGGGYGGGGGAPQYGGYMAPSMFTLGRR